MPIIPGVDVDYISKSLAFQNDFTSEDANSVGLKVGGKEPDECSNARYCL